MRKIREWILRFGGLFNKQRKDKDLEQEIQSHLDLHIEDNLQLGMTPEEARRDAMIKLGGVEGMKEAYRDQLSLPVLETLWQDVRFGARLLFKNPGFTSVAVLTIGLGIGANTAIFSIVDTVLLRPLPFPESNELFVVDLNGGPGTLSVGDFEDIKENSHTFSHVAVFGARYFNLSGDGAPERILSSQVSDGFFSLLGINPLIGRGFLSQDHPTGGEKVAVLSEGLWRHRFGADQTVLGRTVRLDGENYVVVGVMPSEVDFPRQTALWVPMAQSSVNSKDYTGYFLKMIARLKPNITTAAALGELSTISSLVESNYPDYRKKWTWNLIPLHDQLVGPVRMTLLVLLGSVGFVLCIACTNVANLLLGLAARRQKEISIRTALGATRGRLLRQILTESFMLAGAGGALGLAIAHWSIALLNGLVPVSMSQSLPLALNGTVLWVTLIICLMAGLFFGLAPALQVGWSHSAGLNQRTSNPTGFISGRLQSCLVISEVALTFMLLIGAGVLLKSFYLLNQVPLGFQPEQLLTARIDMEPMKYSTSQRQVHFQEELLEHIQSLPGVQNAGVISVLPFSGGRAFSSFSAEGHEESQEMLMAGVRAVAGEYFHAMRIPLLRGREFNDGDRAGSLPVAIINQAMAGKYWPGVNPIGQRIKFGVAPWTEIVGVVGSVRGDAMEKDPEPEMFFPFAQNSGTRINLVLRTSADSVQIASSIGMTVAALDKDQAVFGIQTMRQRLSESITEPRLRVILLGTFAGLALLLSLIGIYGVFSYSVARRTREIGIRMALGAQRAGVLTLILGQGFRLTCLGLVLGLAGALGLTRFLGSFLYQVQPTDAFTFGAVLFLLPLAALLACYLPARRATKVHPTVALRYE